MSNDSIILNGEERSLAHASAWLQANDGSMAWMRPIRETIEEWQKGYLSVNTSGTTGDPKTIRFTTKELVASVELTRKAFQIQHGERALYCLPADYIAGKMMIIRAIVLKLDLHIIKPTANLKRDLNGTYGFAAMAPNQLARLLQNGHSISISKIIVGGEPVSTELVHAVRSRNVRAWHTYGSTETCTHVAFRAMWLGEDVFTGVDGVSFECDENSKLIINTPHLNETTHFTNDVVECLNPTSFRWIGRADNVVLSGGLKLYPEQLEQRCAGLFPNAFYFAKDEHPELGEVLTFHIEDSSESDSSILEKLRLRLDRLEMPEKIHSHLEFKRTGTGKIIRI